MSQKLAEPKHKFKTTSGFREFSVCKNQRIFLAVIYDTIRIYNTDYQSPINIVKLDTTPRSAKISQCGKYFYVHDTNNTIYLYDTRSGNILQQIVGTPTATKSIRFSQNSQKLIYGSTQMLCLWNIRKCQIDIRTQHWRNMNCYDINKDGTQFAIGTYNGVIYVLDFVQVGRCSQIQIKRHKTCIAAICCFENQIISASHDGYFLISTISKDINDERTITYNEMKMKEIPKQIQTVGNNFYMFNNLGMTWFNRANGYTLTGFTDHKTYRPFVNQNGQSIFVSLYSGELQWWPASVFKTAGQIEKAKKQKEKQLAKQKQANQHLMRKQQNLEGKQNKVTYRIIYHR